MLSLCQRSMRGAGSRPSLSSVPSFLRPETTVVVSGSLVSVVSCLALMWVRSPKSGERGTLGKALLVYHFYRFYQFYQPVYHDAGDVKASITSTIPPAPRGAMYHIVVNGPSETVPFIPQGGVLGPSPGAGFTMVHKNGRRLSLWM